MGTPAVPVPLGPLPPLQPEWSTTLRRNGAVRTAINQAEPGAPGSFQDVDYEQVAYDPDASDLVRQVLLFRAFHGYWAARNVAVVEYTTISGETRFAFSTSSSNGSTHSEEKLVLFLQELQNRGELGGVSRVYSERQPCNGRDSGHNCDHMLGNSPLMAGVKVEYSYDYTLWVREEDPQRLPGEEEEDFQGRVRVGENAEFNADREALRQCAEQEGWHAQARDELADDLHILPATDSRSFPLAFDDRDLPPDRRTNAFDVPQEEYLDSARAYEGDDLGDRMADPASLGGDGRPLPPPPPPAGPPQGGQP